MDHRLVMRWKRGLCFLCAVPLAGAASAVPSAASADPVVARTGELLAFRVPARPLLSTPEAESERVRHLTVLMVGDTGCAPSRTAPKPDGVFKHGAWQSFGETTDRIRTLIDGDVNFANIETVISDSDALRPMPKAFNFASHPNCIRNLVKVGFNLFSMANNHAFDYGAEGIRQSLRHAGALLGHGLLAHAGIGLDRTQAARVPVFERKGFRVAFGSIGIGASGNGIQRATENRPGQLGLTNRDDLALLAGNLRHAAADLRLLSIHRGPERYSRPSGHEVVAVRRLVDQSDADIMIGHHAHVARGLEVRNGRLVVYGLGNFLHHGTANMNGKGGCQDFSLVVRAHFVGRKAARPELAAVEVVPVQDTHFQTVALNGKQAARRIAVLNGFAGQFDDPSSGAKGVRFVAQDDGTGIFCTKAAALHPATKALCRTYRPDHLEAERFYAVAAASCGRQVPMMIARNDTQETEVALAKPDLAPLTVKPAVLAIVTTDPAGPSVARQARELEQNPAYWPAGMPLAWDVPVDETPRERHARWRQKRYSVAEVEALLIKRGFLKPGTIRRLN